MLTCLGLIPFLISDAATSPTVSTSNFDAPKVRCDVKSLLLFQFLNTRKCLTVPSFFSSKLCITVVVLRSYHVITRGLKLFEIC